MRNKIIPIVEKICNTESTSCRGLNKANFARELMDIANIPQNADIQEIPLDWDNQVVVLFLLPDDKNYYSLFAGSGTDGNFYFELSITGKLKDNRYFDFFDDDIMLPIDFFKAYAEQKQKEAHKEIIVDICHVINNCANCYDDGAMKINCNPLQCVHLYDVSADSFYMDPYEDKTNKELIGIAEQHGYNADIVIEDGKTTGIKFQKNDITKESATKQAILENVLYMSLTSQQLKFIKDEWKAFYKEPEKYKDSVVVDMVKLSLSE